MTKQCPALAPRTSHTQSSTLMDLQGRSCLHQGLVTFTSLTFTLLRACPTSLANNSDDVYASLTLSFTNPTSCTCYGTRNKPEERGSQSATSFEPPFLTRTSGINKHRNTNSSGLPQNLQRADSRDVAVLMHKPYLDSHFLANKLYSFCL